jgi:cytochrome P450
MAQSQAPVVVAHADPAAEQIFFQLMSNPMNDDPYTGYHQLRAAAPALLTGDGTLVLSRHADCDAALRHRALGKTSDMRGYLLTPIPEEDFTKAMALLQRSMSFANPPEHTRLRQQVGSAFANRHVEALRDGIAQRVDAMLDALAAQPAADFMATLAKPLPISIMGDLVGVPESDRATVSGRFREFAALAEPIVDADVFARATAAQDALAGYFTDLLATRREHPGDDLITRLGTAQDSEGLDQEEIVSTMLLLFGAGIETTTNMLGNGLYALLTHPEQMDRLRRDRQLIPAAVEELLRYDSPVQLDARTVLEPVMFAGVELQPGQTVTTLLGAANRDPERFADPDELDLGRIDNGHLSFASGVHFCLGAHLARLEAQVFLERLLARCAAVTLEGSPQRRAGFGLRGFAQLPVTLHT